MKLPESEWRRRPGMADLLAALGGDEGQTRFVGGCVRDTLLGLPVSDVDLATRLDPGEVMRQLEKANIRAVPTGIAHGTVTAILPGGPVEVTTLRKDVSTDGRRATIVYTGDWREDAARRDFTINALSADPSTGEISDYFEGLQDLEQRRVRFIGDPLTRIAEDHLRILRFFRFHARFGAEEPDAAALRACAARANDLMALSRERIADELLKLLALPAPVPVVRLMVEKAILAPVLPEIGMEGVERLDRLAAREEAAGIGPDPLRRLASLLPQDPAVVVAVASRLRLSKKALKRLEAAASHPSGGDVDAPALAYRIGRDEAVDSILLGSGSSESAAAAVARLDGWVRPRFKLGGGDLIAMGLNPGPIVARTLQAIERLWCERGFPEELETQRQLARAQVEESLRDNR